MNLATLIEATSFAVVGASQDERKVGHQILRNLHSNPSFTVYPINPKGGEILGLTVIPSLSELQTPVDVVVIAIPHVGVAAIIDECLQVKPRAVVLITAGFAEDSSAGAILQNEIIGKLDQAGIALLGPNTMGYVVPSKQLYASFGPSEISKGPIALISQSGAILSALFQEYVSAGTGVSFAISLGNRTGITENDALTYAINDPNTSLVVVYLESISNPQEFLNISKNLSIHKPIFLLKGGSTDAGRKAAASHTAALATSQVLLDELCQQAGIVQVDNFEQLVRASEGAAKLTALPENVMIVTNAGGPAVVLTDEISEGKVPLATLSATTMQALAAELPGLKISNPLDLLGDATPTQYKQALDILGNDPAISQLVAVVTQQAVTDLPALTIVLSQPFGKHLLFACLAGGDQMQEYRDKLKQAGILVCRYPNEVAETLSALFQAKTNLSENIELVKVIDVVSKPYPKDFLDVTNLLKECNIQSPKQLLISDNSELPKLQDFKWPLIGKTTNLQLLHKAKLGAVIQDILNLEQATAAFTHLQQWGTQVVFQQKITTGIEVLLGISKDPFWGWYMAIGMGGSLSDTFDDRAYIFLPATPVEIKKALERTKVITLLNPIAIDQLVLAATKLAEYIKAIPNLTEIEINPLFVTDEGVIAADLKRS
ncbi:MAG: acetate--CoA ligase family protein [bacterium]